MADSSNGLGTAMVFDAVRALEEGAVFTSTNHSPESSARADPNVFESEDGRNLRLPDLLEAFSEPTELVETLVEDLPHLSGPSSALRRLPVLPAIAAQQTTALDRHSVSTLALPTSLSTPAVETEEDGEAQPAAADSMTPSTIHREGSELQPLGAPGQTSSPQRHCSMMLARGSSTSSPSREDHPPGSSNTEHGRDADIGLQFLCPICLEVCEDAVETPCCHNLFCHNCLLAEEHRIERCPICKCALQAVDVLPNIPVRRVVSDLPCACRFDGCGTTLRRRDRARHEAVCDFLPVRCRYSAECGPLLRGELARHEAEECPRRPVTCPMACGFTVSFDCLEDHLGLDCPRVLCICEFCEAPVCRAELPEHTRHHCPRALVVCGLLEEETQARCDFRLERRHLAEHRDVCAFRPVICRHPGCSIVTTARLLESHEDTCQCRRLACPDCGEDVRMGNLQQHLEAECPDHIVSCPFSAHGCTTLVPRRLIDDHLRQATSDHLGFVCSTLASRDVELEILRMEVAHMREDFEYRLQRLERGDSRGNQHSSFSHQGVSSVNSLPAPRITALPAMGIEATSLGPLPPPPPPPPPPPVLLPRAIPGVHGPTIMASPVPSSVADSNMEQWLSATHPAPLDMRGGFQPTPLRRENGAPQASLIPRRGMQGSLGAPLLAGRNHAPWTAYGDGGSLGVGVSYRSRNQSQQVPPPPVPHHAWHGRGTSHPSSARRTEAYQPTSRTSIHDVSNFNSASTDGGGLYHMEEAVRWRGNVSESPLPSPRSPSSIPPLPPPPQRAPTSGSRLPAVVEIPIEAEPELEIMEDLTGVEFDY